MSIEKLAVYVVGGSCLFVADVLLMFISIFDIRLYKRLNYGKNHLRGWDELDYIVSGIHNDLFRQNDNRGK